MTMRRLSRVCVLCVGMAALGCSGRPFATDLALPHSLVLAPGAYDIVPEKKADGTNGVTYTVHEAFPADVLLARIRAALPSPEWEPMADDWRNPGMPSSHKTGWGDYTDGTQRPPRYVHQWMAQWRDQTGNVVFYDLKYFSVLMPGNLPALERQPDNDKVRVTAMWVPKAVAERLMSWGASRRHEIK